MTALLVYSILGGFAVGAVIGYAVCYLRREWGINQHTRCVLCEGTGRYNQVLGEQARSGIADQWGAR